MLNDPFFFNKISIMLKAKFNDHWNIVKMFASQIIIFFFDTIFYWKYLSFK